MSSTNGLKVKSQTEVKTIPKEASQNTISSISQKNVFNCLVESNEENEERFFFVSENLIERRNNLPNVYLIHGENT